MGIELRTMNTELKTENLSEIKSIAEELLTKSEECENVEDKKKIEDDLSEVVNFYTATSKAECYKNAKASDDAMKFAITTFFFPVIKVKEVKDKETGIVLRSIVDGERPIDLIDLHKKIGGIGANKSWLYRAQKLNYHLTIRAAQRVGAKVNSDAFIMHEVARELDMGKNPCSNNQLIKTLQTTVDEMLGEGYKVTSHDVHYLVDCYANDNKKSKTSITAANHKTLVGYLKKVCYRILTNGKGYDVVQREIKESK